MVSIAVMSLEDTSIVQRNLFSTIFHWREAKIVSFDRWHDLLKRNPGNPHMLSTRAQISFGDLYPSSTVKLETGLGILLSPSWVRGTSVILSANLRSLVNRHRSAVI
jgi:hypothetical protein